MPDLVLTESLQKALAEHPGEPLRVVDPVTKQTYVLLREADYESVRQLLAEESTRQAIHAAAMRNAMGRMHDEP